MSKSNPLFDAVVMSFLKGSDLAEVEQLEEGQVLRFPLLGEGEIKLKDPIIMGLQKGVKAGVSTTSILEYLQAKAKFRI